MNKTKIFLSLVLALSVLILQVGGVLAAPASQESDLLAGIVKSIMLETDPNTGITTATVVVKDADQTTHTLRISQEAAIAVGLVALDGDGNPVINKRALGKPIEIDPAKIIPDQPTERHPVGNALETFFKDIDGVNYDVIMKAYEDGTGFGVIAQVLWLTQQIPAGDVTDFQALLFAKQNNDYSNLPFDLVDESGTTITPKNWGQLRKAILDGNQVDKSNNTVSNQNNGSNQNHENNKNKDKEKKDKDKGNSGNNENGNDKDKNKNK